MTKNIFTKMVYKKPCGNNLADQLHLVSFQCNRGMIIIILGHFAKIISKCPEICCQQKLWFTHPCLYTLYFCNLDPHNGNSLFWLYVFNKTATSIYHTAAMPRTVTVLMWWPPDGALLQCTFFTLRDDHQVGQYTLRNVSMLQNF